MRPPLRAAKLFQACDSFEDAAQLVSELLRQYVGVRRWYALRRIGSHWSAVDTRDLARLEARDAQLFAESMLTALSEATGPLLVAHIRDFAPASEVTAENAGTAYLIGAPLIQRRRLDGFVCGLTDAIPYSEIRQNRSLIQASVRLLNTLLELDVQARTLRRWAERARAQTLLDPLTALLNRRGWDQLVQKEETRAQRYGRAATLFVIDLDGFKEVNDRVGHAAGDKILRAAAAALSRATRANDLVARLGGDEFGVLAVESDEETGAKLYRRLAEALENGGVSASIGMAQMGELSAAEALRAADRAMYAAKRRRAGGES
jgi:diguanylate cyclase (GGDEF)-like protein